MARPLLFFPDMRLSIRKLFLCTALSSLAFGCGAADEADTTQAAHAAPDFHHADRAKTPESVAEEKDMSASEGRRFLHPEDVVFFEFDSDQLTPSAREYLKTAAEWLVTHPGRPVMVEGHADPTGTAAYNADLAHRRAETCRRFLVDSGVAEARISIVSLGESRAIYDKDDMNRRTVVYVTE